jgi:hypothetical protein
MALQTPNIDATDLAVTINGMHGQAVESKHAISVIANTVRNSLASQSGQVQGTVSRAVRDLQSKLSKRGGTVQSTIDQTITDLSGGLLSTIESAAIPLVDLGIELPTASDLATAKASLVPSSNPAITGQSAPAPLTGTQGTGTLSPLATGSTGGGGGAQWPYTCNVHLLPAGQQIYYKTLVQTVTGEYACSAYPLFTGNPPQAVIRQFPNWWNCELACRLITECGWTIQQMIPYWRPIDATVYGIVNRATMSGPFCSTAADIFNAWLAAFLGTGTASGSPIPGGGTGTTGAGGTGGTGGIDTCPAGYHLVNGQCIPN